MENGVLLGDSLPVIHQNSPKYVIGRRRMQQIERNERMPYEALVHLMIPFSPWTLRLQFKGLNLSKSGTFASMRIQELGPELKLADLNKILNFTDSYLLQLDSPFEHLDASILQAKIARKNYDSTRLEIAFEFQESNDELVSLTHELKQQLQAN
ncbi:MAG: hypothetical protein R3B45_13860 [Bdellovibrionota bacterium]